MPEHNAREQLETLEQLLALPGAALEPALIQSSDLATKALRADKVDVFLYDPARDTLTAVGSSTQPLSSLQKKLGLDALPVSNGGRTVQVYASGETFVSGKVESDPEELRGIREALKIRSQMVVAFDVAGKRRGVLLVTSLEPDMWSTGDVRFAETIARWVGSVVHRAELVEELERTAEVSGRTSAAEEMVTVLAHDLRNFISPADIALQLIHWRAERDRRQLDLNDAGKARRALARVNAMVTDILDVARLEQGLLATSPTRTRLKPLLEEIVQVLATGEQPVEFTSHEDLEVLVDAARIRQCVENLVGNAIKHSPRLAPVTVALRSARNESGETVQIEVSDLGPGVAPQVMPYIFHRYVAGPDQQAGLGLGLYLAKQIAELHGGELAVTSEPGKGARFLLTLPLNRSG